jgi:serine/threonine-protein kinase HipA
MPRILNLYLSDQLVAQLTSIPGDRSILTLTEAYVADGNRPTLSLGFKGSAGGIAYTPKARQTRIDPYLSNLLPEGKLREYVADRDGIHPEREFELLRILGEDLPGGLIARLDNENEPVDTATPNGANAPAHDGPIKFSLAGVQMKLSALKDATGGLTIPASGKGGNWIVKFPSERFAAVPENEYWMMTLAGRVGLRVPEIDLIGVDTITGMPSGIRTDLGRALIVKRFDRVDNGKRVHMEDFAQIFRVYPSEKYKSANYEQIADVIWREMGEKGLADYVSRLVFTTAIGNGDMHLKNWSILYPDGRTPELTPVYDYLSTLTYVERENLGLNLAGSKRFEDVSLDSFGSLADRIRAPSRLVLHAASAMAERMRAEWPNLAKEAELPKQVLQALGGNLDRVPLFRA